MYVSIYNCTQMFCDSFLMLPRRSHLQPIVSAGVACMKRDIGEAVLDFVTCHRCGSAGRRDTVMDEDEDGDEDKDESGDDTERPISTNTDSTDTSGRSNRARRSSVFNSFLSWNNASVTASSRSSQRSSTYGSRNAEGNKTALPPIASSGVTTSEAVTSVQDDDIFIPEETVAPIEEEEECEEDDETPRDDNV